MAVGLREPELGPTATEETGEDLLEALVHRVVGLLEQALALAVHLLDRLIELPERVLEVLLLRAEVLEALGLLVVLLDRGEVDLTHPLDEPGELVDAGLHRLVGDLAQVVVAEDLAELEPMTLAGVLHEMLEGEREFALFERCLLYTSDAADE